MSNNPSLNLEYNLSPSHIDVTVDSSHLVKNKLTLTIINPFKVPITFIPSSSSGNTDEGVHVPGESDPVIINSCFEIWFNYAPNESKVEDRGSDLCTYAAAAANINISSGTNASNWTTVKRDSSKVYNGRKIGTYWQLYPTAGTQLAPKESIAFDITDIISDTPADIATAMHIEVVDFPDYANTYKDESIYKKTPFKIKSFALSDQQVYEGGTTKITWSTVGASYVTFAPPLDPSDPDKQYPANSLTTGETITPKALADYIMTAWNEQGDHLNSNPVSLIYYPLTIHKFECNQQTIGVNGLVLFRWLTSNAQTVQTDILGQNYGAFKSGQAIAVFGVKGSYTCTVTATNKHNVTKNKSIQITVNSDTTTSGTIPGAIGPNHRSSANSGEPVGCGMTGNNGQNGTGGHPPPATFELPVSTGASTPKQLTIQGGAGQDGGNGGAGGPSCEGSVGRGEPTVGPAGNGGNGGNGGPGGSGSTSLTFTHTSKFPEYCILSLPASSGGRRGQAGPGGQGGQNPNVPGRLPNGNPGGPGYSGPAGGTCTYITVAHEISQTEVEALVKAAKNEAKDPG